MNLASGYQNKLRNPLFSFHASVHFSSLFSREFFFIDSWSSFYLCVLLISNCFPYSCHTANKCKLRPEKTYWQLRRRAVCN